MSSIQLSVVVPVSERAQNLFDTHDSYLADLEQIDLNWEMIYVFSESNSALATEFQPKVDDRVSIITLTRNFGEGTAIQVGTSNAKGELVLTLPAYQQVAQGELKKLFEKMQESEAELVIAKRWPRIDGPTNRLQTSMFNFFIKMFSDVDFSDLGCGIRLFKKKIMEDISIYGDQHRFFPLIAHEYGVIIEEVELKQSPNESTKRLYSPGIYLRRLLDLLAIIFVTKFNKKPLRFFGLIGASTFTLGLLFLVAVTIQRYGFDVSAANRPFMLISVLMMSLGVQLVAIGLVGETIIFTHAKDIKEYHIREIVNGEKSSSEQSDAA